MLFLKSTSRHFNQTERQTFGKQPFKFLANVNSRSRSIYTIAVPSVVCLSVTYVHPTQPVEIFGNVFSPFGTLAIH